MKRIAIIGAGIGGTCAALELAKYDCEIALLESSNQILNRTSARTPGRLGLGFHYPGDKSLQTAQIIIKAAFELKKAFPESVLGIQRYGQDYLTRGWYFITKDSQQSPENFINYCHALRTLYEKEYNESKLVNYGAPNDFFRILHLDEYKNTVNVTQVSLGVETCENLINWNTLASTIKLRLAQNNRIKIHNWHKVIDIDKKFDGYLLTIQKQGDIITKEYFDIIVNATCDYRLYLDSKLGFHKEQPWTNRLKLLAKIYLPQELAQTHSMFFARGPFAMLTNAGNNIGFVTYAPVTNYAQLDASLVLPTEWETMITQGLNDKMQKMYGQKILNGVANYIPLIKKAEIIETIAGIVQHDGNANIYDEYSDMHRRYRAGIFRYAPNYFSLDTGKLSFAPYYAKKLSQWFCRSKMIKLQ